MSSTRFGSISDVNSFFCSEEWITYLQSNPEAMELETSFRRGFPKNNVLFMFTSLSGTSYGYSLDEARSKRLAKDFNTQNTIKTFADKIEEYLDLAIASKNIELMGNVRTIIQRLVEKLDQEAQIT